MGTFPEGTELHDPTTKEASEFANSISGTLIELTHNHGTELDPEFKHHNGNTDPRGFGHIGFLVDNLEETCERMEKEQGVKFHKRPQDGMMRNIAFALDPDNYWVELIRRTTWPTSE